MEAIILAGGLGTRLRGVIGEAPKCMAPVNGKPFLAYLFRYLEQQGCTRVILSLGYKHDAVTAWLSENTFPFSIDFVVEQEPLGTGGGIQLALAAAREENVTVLNGDTMFITSLAHMLAHHTTANAATTLALKQMHHFDRYGIVHTSHHGGITNFEEKRYCESGHINGGIYIINRSLFFSKELPSKFSFEKDYLERFVQQGAFSGYVSDGYFIDIGIPADYNRAQEDFKTLFP